MSSGIHHWAKTPKSLPELLMVKQPTLSTARLLLRPFTEEDVPNLQCLAGVWEIADTTLSVPHPYTLNDAQQWLKTTSQAYAHGSAVHFAIAAKPNQQLLGAISLNDINREHLQTELGFWIGREFWGQGFASEAGQRLISYGFKQLDLNRIYADHMVRNPASGKVLQKIGMQSEGLLRQRVRKWGVFEDVILMAILRQDWLAARNIDTNGPSES